VPDVKFLAYRSVFCVTVISMHSAFLLFDDDDDVGLHMLEMYQSCL